MAAIQPEGRLRKRLREQIPSAERAPDLSSENSLVSERDEDGVEMLK